MYTFNFLYQWQHFVSNHSLKFKVLTEISKIYLHRTKLFYTALDIKELNCTALDLLLNTALDRQTNGKKFLS